jgi:hypothetical protein
MLAAGFLGGDPMRTSCEGFGDNVGLDGSESGGGRHEKPTPQEPLKAPLPDLDWYDEQQMLRMVDEGCPNTQGL